MSIENNSQYTLSGFQVQDIISKIKNISNVANSALPNTTNYGSNLYADLNSQTYALTFGLKDQNGNFIGTNQTIDLPLESVVVNGSYNSSSKNVVLELQSGSNIEFSVADLVSGLQSEINANNMLDIQYVNLGSNSFVNESQLNKINNLLSIENVKAPLYFNSSNNTLYASDLGGGGVEFVDINMSANFDTFTSTQSYANVSNFVNDGKYVILRSDYGTLYPLSITNANYFTFVNSYSLNDMSNDDNSIEFDTLTWFNNDSKIIDSSLTILPIITMTTNDPGEGSPLDAKHFIAVYNA